MTATVKPAPGLKPIRSSKRAPWPSLPFIVADAAGRWHGMRGAKGEAARKRRSRARLCAALPFSPIGADAKAGFALSGARCAAQTIDADGADTSAVPVRVAAERDADRPVRVVRDGRISLPAAYEQNQGRPQAAPSAAGNAVRLLQ
ncbi:hypothetical protein [Burkholderia multivorans]|uniref:hypothetical protein n=1 Tax=Burkholderia multivorans TaxID=87883 RepID=UPI0011B28DBE|nr:hypothetical protein [Burkholderia multivorans]